MSWATQYIKDLQQGKTIEIRPRGNSMTGRISSGQLCRIKPIENTPQRGDIVLCKVRGNQYLHLITAVRGDQFQISNNHGHINGWTSRSNIFGLLVSVV